MIKHIRHICFIIFFIYSFAVIVFFEDWGNTSNYCKDLGNHHTSFYCSCETEVKPKGAFLSQLFFFNAFDIMTYNFVRCSRADNIAQTS